MLDLKVFLFKITVALGVYGDMTTMAIQCANIPLVHCIMWLDVLKYSLNYCSATYDDSAEVFV